MTASSPTDATEQLRDALLDSGDVDAALAAIAAGADLRRIEDLSGENYTALTWAVGGALGAEGSLRLVRALIAARMTVAEEHPSDGLTSLHRAAEEGFVQVIEALLGAGGKSALGSFDYINRTPLICAVHKGVATGDRGHQDHRHHRSPGAHPVAAAQTTPCPDSAPGRRVLGRTSSLQVRAEQQGLVVRLVLASAPDSGYELGFAQAA